MWSRLLKPIQRASAFFANVAIGVMPQEEQHQRLLDLAAPDVLGVPTLAEVIMLELHIASLHANSNPARRLLQENWHEHVQHPYKPYNLL